MSNKLTDAYLENVLAIQSALENLQEFADSLPAPNDNGEVNGIDWGHVGTLGHVKTLLADITSTVDLFN